MFQKRFSYQTGTIPFSVKLKSPFPINALNLNKEELQKIGVQINDDLDLGNEINVSLDLT